MLTVAFFSCKLGDFSDSDKIEWEISFVHIDSVHTAPNDLWTFEVERKLADTSHVFRYLFTADKQDSPVFLSPSLDSFMFNNSFPCDSHYFHVMFAPCSKRVNDDTIIRLYTRKPFSTKLVSLRSLNVIIKITIPMIIKLIIDGGEVNVRFFNLALSLWCVCMQIIEFYGAFFSFFLLPRAAPDDMRYLSAWDVAAFEEIKWTRIDCPLIIRSLKCETFRCCSVCSFLVSQAVTLWAVVNWQPIVGSRVD